MKALNPDVIIDATVGTSTATVLRAIKDAGMDDLPVMSSLGNVIHAQIDQYTAILPREIYFVAPGFISRDITPKGPVRDAQQVVLQGLQRARDRSGRRQQPVLGPHVDPHRCAAARRHQRQSEASARLHRER